MSIEMSPERLHELSDSLFDFWADELKNDKAIRAICRADTEAFAERFGIPNQHPLTRQYAAFMHGCRSMYRTLLGYEKNEEAHVQ